MDPNNAALFSRSTSLKHHSFDVNIDADYDSKVIFI